MGSEDGSLTVPGAMKIKNVFYDNAFNVGASNFHWESGGSFLQTHDLYLRFAIPYTRFKMPPDPPHEGRPMTVQIDFSSRLGSNSLSFAKTVFFY